MNSKHEITVYVKLTNIPLEWFGCDTCEAIRQRVRSVAPDARVFVSHKDSLGEDLCNPPPLRREAGICIDNVRLVEVEALISRLQVGQLATIISCRI